MFKDSKKTIWRLRERAQNTNYTEFESLVHQVLYARDMDRGQVLDFLNPTIEKLHDPLLLPDMKKAVDCIFSVIDKEGKIIVYGDYDVDGITSIAVLVHAMSELGVDIDYYIPDRMAEGYGLNLPAVEKLSKEYDLMITVDCGITNYNEILYAMQHQMNVIVTDHHLPNDQLPPAVAVVNPQRIDNHYPNKYLAGVGVVFKLCEALLAKKIGLKKARKKMMSWIDIVAIGTIADLAPLQGENRIIAILGLSKINNNITLQGLSALINVCQLKNKEITSGHIGFGLAPRLNAGGRVGSALNSLELLLTDDFDKAMELAMLLDSQNEKRRALEKRIEAQAIEMIEQNYDNYKYCIMLCHDNWHHGVLGIVASRLVEKYFRPTILLTREDDILKGSGRSIPAIHLQNILQEEQALLHKFGGHAVAVGLSIKPDNFVKLQNRLSNKIKQSCTSEDLTPQIMIDLTVNINELTIDEVKELNMIKPCGIKNPTPNVLIRGAKIQRIDSIGRGKHTKVVLEQQQHHTECIFWQTSDANFNIGDLIDIVGQVEENSWNNITKVNIIGKDWRLNYFNEIIDCRDCDNKDLYLDQNISNNSVIVFHGYDFGQWNYYVGDVIKPFGRPLYLYYNNNEYTRIHNLENYPLKNVYLYDIPFQRNHLAELKVSGDISLHLLYNKNDYKHQQTILQKMYISRQVLGQFYRYLQSVKGDCFALDYKTQCVNDDLRYLIVKRLTMLKIFSELDFLEWRIKDSNLIEISFNENVIKKDLMLSNTYKTYAEFVQQAPTEMEYLLNVPLSHLSNSFLRRT